MGDTPTGRRSRPSARYRAHPTGRLVTAADVVHAVSFLLENQGVNAVNLVVDGGSLLK